MQAQSPVNMRDLMTPTARTLSHGGSVTSPPRSIEDEIKSMTAAQKDTYRRN